VAVASAGPYASLHLAPDRNHTSTPPLSFLQAGCPSCRPTNSVTALKATVRVEYKFTRLTNRRWSRCEAAGVTIVRCRRSSRAKSNASLGRARNERAYPVDQLSDHAAPREVSSQVPVSVRLSVCPRKISSHVPVVCLSVCLSLCLSPEVSSQVPVVAVWPRQQAIAQSQQLRTDIQYSN